MHSDDRTPQDLLQLTPEQVRDWTREAKDRWWLTKVFRGNMPQLTLRSAITGFVLGGLLSATNLYVGAKTGWTLGVGITSVIIAFAMFKVMSRLGFHDISILESNAMQSVATAAGYMTGPLISGMAAYMMVENRLMPWWQMMAFNVVLSLLGVLVAFPMKRRFVNDEQGAFPEGRACGTVLHALYSTADAAAGMFKARALAIAAGGAGFLKLISGENLMAWAQVKLLGFKAAWHLPESLDAWYYNLAEKGWVPFPKLAGVDIRKFGLSPALDLVMFGAGGLIGVRVAASMLVGMFVNFVIVVPAMINAGEIRPLPNGTFTRVHVINTWALWWGIAIMVVASLVALFAKPKVIISAFSGLFRKKDKGQDVLAHIELPLWISFVGVPIVGTLGVWMMNAWFGVRWDLGFLAIPLIILLTLIAVNATALTSITPVGALSKLPQFGFGALNPGHAATNIMPAVMCVEVGSNAANLLMDITPGYMLGAKPRQQAIGHCIGIFAGALASTPLFYALFLSSWQPGQSVQDAMVSDQFGFPAALQWKGISDLVAAVFSGGHSPISNSAVWSMVIAAIVGLIFEVGSIVSRGRFPLSGLAIGLGVVVPPDSTMAMFAGAVFFWAMQRRYAGRQTSVGYRLWIDTREPICAGLIAGAALVGIADILVKVFLL